MDVHRAGWDTVPGGMPCRVDPGYTEFTVRAVDANEGSVFGVSRKAGANDVVNHRKLQTRQGAEP